MSRPINSHNRRFWARSRNYRHLAYCTAFTALIVLFAFSHSPAPTRPAPVPTSSSSAPHYQPPPPPPPKPAAPKPRLVPVSGNRLQDLPPAPNRWSAVIDARVPERGFNAYYLTHGSPARLHRAYHPYNMDRPDGSSVAWAAIGQDRPSLAGYADRWLDRGRLVAVENRGSIRIDYAENEFHNIPAEDFAVCWLGHIHITRGGYYQFNPEGGGLSRIILDRHLIYDSHTEKTPQPVWLEPGTYLLEAEFLSYHHVVSYRLGLALDTTRPRPNSP